jgi:hypothetical protein
MIAALFLRQVVGVPIEAVLGEIDLAAQEPLGEGRFPFENGVPLLLPGQGLGLLGPEAIGIADASRVHLAILLEVLDVRLVRKGRAEAERAALP